MKLLLRLATSIALCALSALSSAGMEKDSNSTRAGLFFAWLSPDDGYVLVHFNAEQKLRKLASHCNAGRHVYSLQKGTRYKCRVQVFKTQSGEDYWESAGVTVQGPVPKSDTRPFGLFSVTPPSITNWVARTPVPDEVAELETLLKSDLQRFGVLTRQLKLGLAKAVHQPGSLRITFVVPGRVVRDDVAHYYAQQHHVFVRQGNGTYSYRGMLPAKPEKYFDVDGDDLPEIMVSEDCDGWCISLWNVSSGTRQIAKFGGH